MQIARGVEVGVVRVRHAHQCDLADDGAGVGVGVEHGWCWFSWFHGYSSSCALDCTYAITRQIWSSESTPSSLGIVELYGKNPPPSLTRKYK